MLDTALFAHGECSFEEGSFQELWLFVNNCSQSPDDNRTVREQSERFSITWTWRSQCLDSNFAFWRSRKHTRFRGWHSNDWKRVSLNATQWSQSSYASIMLILSGKIKSVGIQLDYRIGLWRLRRPLAEGIPVRTVTHKIVSSSLSSLSSVDSRDRPLI